ncbi:hypothetical protein PMW75_05145 [Eggerthella lenta]|uniref:hypothetical protein n=1 Tax=Eggerthella lenta TaxID=84112 RepID=UPI0018AADF9E|nr:hypothetical protein [Eggerthella lenta]MDB1769915.1 hypothetical protein [Eggerthella lenta]MDB1798486.1 hypothetical protein [Eggerthella lenta]
MAGQLFFGSTTHFRFHFFRGIRFRMLLVVLDGLVDEQADVAIVVERGRVHDYERCTAASSTSRPT